MIRSSLDAGHSGRLGLQRGEVIDRSNRFQFSWNGRLYTALEGDSIVSALMASGVGIFSRSFKYHRPRGILSGDYWDPNCLVQVGAEPNVRAAHRKAAPGMVVSPQNSWPSLHYDLKALNQLVGNYIGAGFYYKTFIKPQRLWPLYERVLSRFAAGGTVTADAPAGVYDKRYAHPDVLVAGGGPAGMAAALSAARDGAAVMLVEEGHELGGHLRWGGADELELLARMRSEVAATEGIEVLTDSVVTARYDDNWIAVCQRSLPHVDERLIKARAGALVVAAGLIERPYVFEGNDLPGVMLSTAARRLVNCFAVRPGSRAVVLSANSQGDAAAADLERVGVTVVRLLDARRGEDVVSARGGHWLSAVSCSDGTSIECDLLVTATGWTAPTSLLNMAGDKPVYSSVGARFVPGGVGATNVIPAGGIVGDASLEELVEHGRAAGIAAAGYADRGIVATVPPLSPHAHPEMFRGATHGIVDFSEDVSSKDLISAAREGYDSVELLKRYTTATMGPSQGKLETLNTVAILASETGRSIAETGTTVWRPPYAPITLGALASRGHEPRRLSPMQPWHEAHGARPIVAGQWIRPDHYGDPEDEVRKVRQGVGLIDVSPLGKLDLRGPDVPALLELVYLNRWARLAVGSVRYGVMCSEDGVVLDDGVTGRLGADHYLMSTTSSGAAVVWEWIEGWLQTARPQWAVHVTPVTTGFASINVAGPRSRQLLERVTSEVDLSPESFPYMNVRSASVAGVADCIMWRIGFTGELSFELHVPAGYGLHVWEALFEAGRDLGVVPFGLEAQRIMRLEKGHLIVGQDTDGLTQAYGAGLDWLVKLDKADFCGKPELAWQSGRQDFLHLVGLQPVDRGEVPPEASLITEAGDRIVGRVTSSRHSPTLSRAICLGLVAPRLAQPGTIVNIHLPDGRDVAAKVTSGLAHFDPDGERLRG